jgi:hypothetical protein
MPTGKKKKTDFFGLNLRERKGNFYPTIPTNILY